jgi:Fibronectin type III domain.
VPKSPTNVNVNVIGSGLHVTWDPPPKEKPEVTGYVIKYYPAGGDPSQAETVECEKDCREMFLTDGLKPFTPYTGKHMVHGLDV